jgi:hypothetical protein
MSLAVRKFAELSALARPRGADAVSPLGLCIHKLTPVVDAPMIQTTDCAEFQFLL